MTDAEMTEAVESALGAVEDWDGFGGDARDNRAAKLGRALLESRRQVEALTKERDDVLARHAKGNGWDTDDWYAELSRVEAVLSELGGMEIDRPCSDLVGRMVAERAAATARAERAEAKLAGQCETCGGEGVMYVEPVNGRGGEECVACGECLGSTRGWVAQAIAGKVARVVEAIAAWHDEAARIDGEHGNSFQAYAHALSADHIRSHNWAPPEEESK